jgi:hypothetical protein
MHINKQRSNIYKLSKFKQYNLAHLKHLEFLKNPRFDFSTGEESNHLGNASSFSEEDEDMLILKYLDEATKNEMEKARVALADQLIFVDGNGSGNNWKVIETDSSE